MRHIRDLKGLKFNRMTVIEQAPMRENCHRIRWWCQCDCQSPPKVVVGQALINGNTKSCGCLKAERKQPPKGKIHGMSKSHEFLVWQSLKRRLAVTQEFDCLARPRRIPKLWPDWQFFDQFLADMGKCPPGAKLRRRHISQDYTPETCYWQLTEAPRKRLSSTYFWNGNAATISAIAKAVGMQRATLSLRLHAGQTLEQATTQRVAQPERLTYEHDGQQKTLGELAREFKVPYGYFFYRVKRMEMSVEEAIANIRRPQKWAED